VADWRDYQDEGSDPWSVTQAMGAELVKVAGVKFSKGEWSWSPENTVQYFKDEPLWATFDAVTMAAPVFKWGKAAALVARGSTAAGAEFKAGAMGFREAVSLQGKNLVPMTKVGRFISNPGARGFTPEYMELLAKPANRVSRFEDAALVDVARREAAASEGYVRAQAVDMKNSLAAARMNPAQSERMVRMLESGIKPGSTAPAALFSKPEADLYAKTWKFRAKMGQDGVDLGLLSQDNALRQDTWVPHMYKQEQKAALEKAGWQAGKDATDVDYDSFMHRTMSTEEFERFAEAKHGGREFDMAKTIDRMAGAAHAIAREKFAATMASSSVAMDAEGLLKHLQANVLDNPRLLKVWGMSVEKAALLKERIPLLPRTGANGKLVDEAFQQYIAHEVGWARLGDVAPGMKLRPKWRDMYVDKMAAQDIEGGLKLLAPESGLARQLVDGYSKTMRWFTQSKTTMNPAGYVRNLFGAAITHTLGAGLHNFGQWQRGWKMYREGMANPMFVKAAEAGHTAASIAWDDVGEMAKILGGKAPSVFDFLGEGKIATAIKDGHLKATTVYRAIDEIPRLDVFARSYEKFKAAHGTRWAADELEKRALDHATLHTAKYSPSNLMHSDLTNTLRNVIPFSSFSHEMIRIWKNAMVEAPHKALFWSHFSDLATDVAGAVNGMSSDEVEAAKANVPYYVKGRKMAMWPAMIDGKPEFLDMSYLIPLANIADIERDQNQFFGTALGSAGLNPTSNPFWSMIQTAATGQDAFKNAPVEPQFTERQLGIPVEGELARTTVGLAEHAARTFLPPLVPPGFAGNNLLEWARGQKHPQTGAPLEDGMWRTLSTNLAGMRLYEADANSAMLNVGNQERVSNERVSDWWKRWAWAQANGDGAAAAEAEDNLREMKVAEGKTRAEAEKYVHDGVEQRMPGDYKNYSKTRIQKAMQSLDTLRAGGMLGSDPEDVKQVTALQTRMRQQRRKRTSRARSASAAGVR
jgi:hypothetical protein